MTSPSGVSVVEISQNSKVGQVSATYAAQQSCPKSCQLRNSGCYAESGMVGMQTRRLNRANRSAGELARAEAKGIRSLTGRFPLRLHVVGDCKTDYSATTVSSAADEHRAKFGNSVWTYTHAWRDVQRSSWGNVSVLASCETVQETVEAMQKGYAAALVLPKHKQPTAWWEPTSSSHVTVIPCPEQTGKATSCEECRLCWNGGRLRAGRLVIGFAAHAGKAKVKAKLVQIAGVAGVGGGK